MGLIAHPGGVCGFACQSKDGLLFTGGGEDLTMNMWKLNPEVVDAHALLMTGDEGDILTPF